MISCTSRDITTYPRFEHGLQVLEGVEGRIPDLLLLVDGPLRLQYARNEEAPPRGELLVDALQAAEELYPVEVQLQVQKKENSN